MEPQLVETFLSSLKADARRELEGRGDLAATLEAHVLSARTAWPGVALGEEAFLSHLADRMPDAETQDALAATHASDLWLAAACTRSVDGAAALLDRHFLPQLDGVLSRAGVEMRDELKQRIREKLLVALPGKLPRIGEYTGRGPLQGWLKVVASRMALDFLRTRDPPSPGDDELLALPSAGADPELLHLRDRYREEFRVAMAEGAKALGARGRTVLRLHYIDGLTMEEIAALHRVHRITAVRWVTEAREELAATTRRVLLQRYGIGRRELDSILGLMQSQMDLSIRVLLRTSAPTGVGSKT